TDTGKVALIDCMPPRSDYLDLVRVVEGRGGKVPMRFEMIIRFDYGSIIPWVRHAGKGIRATAGPDTLYCRSPIELRGEDMHTVADFTVSQGERLAFDMIWTPTYSPEPAERDPEETLDATEKWWQEWS